MNFRIYILCFFLFASPLFSQAQESASQDVIYLKDGSMIRGEIVEQLIGESVTIEILGGSLLVYQEENIARISREDAKVIAAPVQSMPAMDWKTLKGPITVRGKGIYSLVSFGLGFGQSLNWNGNYNLSVHPSLQYRIGNRFSQYVSAGVGTGIDFYQGGVMMPFFLDFHGEIGPEKRLMPHYFANLGYSAAIGRGWDVAVINGGPMVHVGAGWKINTSRKLEWVFSLGYKAQHTYQEREIWPRDFWTPTLEPILIKGTRVYQKIVMQLSMGF